MVGRKKRAIADAAKGALQTTKAHENEIRQLRQKIEHMTRVIRGLMTLLEEKTGITEAQVIEQVEKIEESELGFGGQPMREAPECGSCGRPLQEDSPTCIYCGQENELPPGLF